MYLVVAPVDLRSEIWTWDIVVACELIRGGACGVAGVIVVRFWTVDALWFRDASPMELHNLINDDAMEITMMAMPQSGALGNEVS